VKKESDVTSNVNGLTKRWSEPLTAVLKG
jgi:hypothetical protein